MKVKIPYGFNFVTEHDENGFAESIFEEGIYDVIHTFEHHLWGATDKTVYVIINDTGDVMSISAELVKIIDEKS
jgi:hypothetical protein